MLNTIIRSFDQKDFGAYLAMPAQKTGPVVIIIQEIFGVTPFLRGVCDDLAARGYIALCPDLFWRLEAGLNLNPSNNQDRDKAFALFQKFDVEMGMQDLIASLAYARKIPGNSGKVGAMGYCLGGKLAYLLATRSDIDCAVSYYGVGLEGYLSDMPDIHVPTILHIAGLDSYVPPDIRTKILNASARNTKITPYVYEGADHGFARTGGDHFNAEATKLAQERSLDILSKTLEP